MLHYIFTHLSHSSYMSLRLVLLHLHSMLYILIHPLNNFYNLLLHLSFSFHTFFKHQYNDIINQQNNSYSSLIYPHFSFHTMDFVDYISYISTYTYYLFNCLLSYHTPHFYPLFNFSKAAIYTISHH